MITRHASQVMANDVNRSDFIDDLVRLVAARRLRLVRSGLIQPDVSQPDHGQEEGGQGEGEGGQVHGQGGHREGEGEAEAPAPSDLEVPDNAESRTSVEDDGEASRADVAGVWQAGQRTASERRSPADWQPHREWDEPKQGDHRTGWTTDPESDFAGGRSGGDDTRTRCVFHAGDDGGDGANQDRGDFETPHRIGELLPAVLARYSIVGEGDGCAK